MDYSSPPVFFSLSLANPVHSVQSVFFKIHFIYEHLTISFDIVRNDTKGHSNHQTYVYLFLSSEHVRLIPTDARELKDDGIIIENSLAKWTKTEMISIQSKKKMKKIQNGSNNSTK